MKSPSLRRSRAPWMLPLLAVLLSTGLQAAPRVHDFQNLHLGPADGQGDWTYAAGAPLPQDGVLIAPGGLYWIGEDDGILTGGTQYLRTRAGLDGNGRMSNWLSLGGAGSPGSVYVRFLLRMDERPSGIFGLEDYEMFFGFAAGTGGPWDAYAGLKIPATGDNRTGTLETTGSGGPHPNEKLVLGETLLLVTRYDVDSEGALTGMHVWVNPAAVDAESPDLSVPFDEPGVILSELDRFNISGRNMPMALDNLVFADEWEEVVPPPHDGTPRPPVVLLPPASPEGEIGEILELSPLVWDEPGNPVTGYQWVANNTITIPADLGGTVDPLVFQVWTSTAANNPVRLAAQSPERTGALLRVLVSNATGTTTTPNVRIRETQTPEPPEITRQPRDTSFMEGDTVRISVQVFSLIDLTYQWFFNDSPLPGATDATLILPGVTEADAGTYYVEVTNDLGTERSADAALTFDDGSFPADFRVLRLERSAELGGNIAATGQADDQTGGDLSPHDPAEEPPTIASIPVETFNTRIGQAYAEGRGGVFDFAFDKATLLSGRPLTPEEEGAEQVGAIKGLRLDLGLSEIEVVPIVRDMGVEGFAGRDTLLPPNFLVPTGLLPRYPPEGGDPNSATISRPNEGPPDFYHPGHDLGTALPSSPEFALAASTHLKLVFDPADKVELAGFVFVNRDYFQSHRETKAYPDKPNVRAAARFSKGTDIVTLISTGTTRQPGGVGYNTFFGFESPGEGYYLIDLETWALGNNFRCHFSIDDLAVAVAGGGDVPASPMQTWLTAAGVPSAQTGPNDRHGPLSLTNLEAYAMGIPPFESTAADLPRTVRDGAVPGHVTLRYRLNTAAQEVVLSIEQSADLDTAGWYPAEPLTDNVLSESGEIQWREASFAVEAGAPVFLRVKAELAQ
ncbi:MAG: immunoglobulin domain-containing protein [Opitutales bacterium]|nr:immunoglobulin domain-containing protein [Opitutales bacterium]